jgi:uncharacterized protein YjbJ (UPF0337 family)
MALFNTDVAEGNLRQIKGRIREEWGKLTDDEIDQLEGQEDRLAGLLQKKYGMAEADAEREVRRFKEKNRLQ